MTHAVLADPERVLLPRRPRLSLGRMFRDGYHKCVRCGLPHNLHPGFCSCGCTVFRFVAPEVES